MTLVLLSTLFHYGNIIQNCLIKEYNILQKNDLNIRTTGNEEVVSSDGDRQGATKMSNVISSWIIQEKNIKRFRILSYMNYFDCILNILMAS